MAVVALTCAWFEQCNARKVRFASREAQGRIEDSTYKVEAFILSLHFRLHRLERESIALGDKPCCSM